MAETLPEVTVEGGPAPPPQEIRGYSNEPGRIAVIDPDGAVQSIPQENAERALELGWRPASDAELYGEQTGALGTVAAGAFGAARGATFGLFDPLTVGASRLLEGDVGAEGTRQSLDLLRRGHETASMVGEIGGSLAPLLMGVPGGGGEALAEGGSMLSRGLSRAIAATPRAFAEGAAMSAGMQLSEDTLGNHDLVAQKYIVTALEGGVLGAILGAGLHAGVGAVGDSLAARAERLAVKGARAEEAVTAATGRSALGTKLSSIAEEQAAKGMLPSSTISASELSKLGRTTEEQMAKVRQLGRTALDDGISTAGANKTVQAQRATEKVGEVGKELGAIRKTLETSAVRPSAENVVRRIQQEVTLPLSARPFSADAQRAIASRVEEIAERSGAKVGADGALVVQKPTYEKFADLFAMRDALDEELNRLKAWEKFNGQAPGRAELKQIRGILESEVEKAADAAAVDLGEDIGTKYRVAKAHFADLKTIEKWTTKAAGRETQNRAVSLTDTIAAGAGIATGSPLGLLAPVANKMLRTYGNQAGAFMADRAAKLLGVQRAAETYDARKAKAVANFFAGGKKGAKTTAATPKLDPETTRALRAAVKDPAAMTEHVADVVRRTGLHDEAPRVAQAVSNVLMRAGAYLGQRMPPEPPPAGFSFGPPKPRPLGPHAQARLEGIVGALDMESVFADLDHGRVDRQKIEALRIINPEAYQDLIGALRQYGIENQSQLTHQQEIAVSILTGTPIGAMMQPKTIRGFQQAHVQGAPPDPSQAGVQRQPFGTPSGGGSGASSQNADTYRSGTDRMEADNG